MTRDATAAAIRKIRDGNGGTLGAPLWQFSVENGLVGGQPDTLLGKPAYTDPNVASLASNSRIMAFGDFSAYYIRNAGGVRLERSDDYAFNTDETSLRAVWRVDADLLDTSAIVTMVRNV